MRRRAVVRRRVRAVRVYSLYRDTSWRMFSSSMRLNRAARYRRLLSTVYGYVENLCRLIMIG